MDDELVAVIVVVLLIVAAPIVLSIIAIVKASGVRGKIDELERRLEEWAARAAGVPPSPPTPEHLPDAPPPAPASPIGEPGLPPAPPIQGKVPPPMPPPLPSPALASVPPDEPKPPSAAGRQSGMELAIGGRWASIVGIAALLLGVVFFVGYAIQHQWIGPAMRITMGLVSGAVLVAIGHALDRRSDRFRLLARLLTGGGAALFYFCIFAARGIYHLIGPVPTFAGLAAAAAAVFALSLLYRSQTIGVLGLLGAYVAPLLVKSGHPDAIFVLTFAAVINVPVLVLGFMRRWQWLYNLAFLFTLLYAAVMMANGVHGVGPHDWPARVGFSVLFYAQFVGLGLVKLTREDPALLRPLDHARLLGASTALLGSVYAALEAAQLHAYSGAALLAGAALQTALAAGARRYLPRFTNESLIFLLGALAWAGLALPVQLDGAWVSLGWAIIGVLTAYFAARVGSVPLTLVAALFGFLGVSKSVVFDGTLYAAPPRLFLNARFVVGLLSALGLGIQAWIAGRRTGSEAPSAGRRTAVDIGFIVAAISAAIVLTADAATCLPDGSPWIGLLSTVGLLAAGTGLLFAARGDAARPIAVAGVVCLAIVPLKLLIFDLPWGWETYHRLPKFGNTIVWMQIFSLGALVAAHHAGRRAAPGVWAAILHCSAIVSAIAIVSIELGRGNPTWGSPSVTLVWAVAAFVVSGAGIALRRAYLRWLALALFGAAALKAFLLDMAGLHGLPRIAAFLGLGLLLLVLSYVYQRLAPRFSPPTAKPEDTSP